MQVVVYEKRNRVTHWDDVKKIEKKTYHIFITDSDDRVYTHELDDVEKIEVEL